MSIFSGVNNPGVSLNQFTTAQYNALITFSALTDPGADRILGWDHTDNAYAFFTIGTGLTYTHSTHTLTSSGGSGGITIGTTTITSGANTNILYNNSGVVGEYTTTGSGTVVALATSPSFTTPTLGAATATSLATSAASPLLMTNGKLVTVALTAQTVNPTTLTIPDFAGVADEFTFKTKSQTMSNKTFITPVLGAATATSINGNIFTTGTYTLTGTAGKTLNFTNTITLSGTDSTTMTFPTTTATIARTDAGQTFTGTNVFGVITATTLNGNTFTTGTYTLTGTTAKTLNFTNSITLSGTDATTMTFPTTTATLARTDAGQTFTGVNVFTSPKIVTQISDTNGNILVNIGATASAVNYVKVTNAATGTAGPILAADGETNVDLKIAAKGTGGVHFTTGTYGDIDTYAPAGAGTATLDLSISNVKHITMPAGNITIAISNGKLGQCFIVRILQDGTGSRTVTWFSGIKWAGGTVPTLTTTASKADTFGFEVTTAGSAYDGFVIGQNI